MAEIKYNRGNSPNKTYILFLLFFAFTSLLSLPTGLRAQTPSPTPAPPSETEVFGGYRLTSSVELGVRGVDVNGNINKYRSDFNYRSGFRVFDSSFLLENKDDKNRAIDSLLVTSSGWNADPTGFTRISVEKAGFYRFDSNIRQVAYFNNLNNHARNGHTADSRRNFGDFDLTLYPNSDKFRLRFGGGYNRASGDGTITSRAYSDEFPVNSSIRSRAADFRAGVDTNLAGFNLNLSYGYRRFRDNTFYSTFGNPGYNTTNTTVINFFERYYPVRGNSQFVMFNAQRTFAKKLDLTARVIYSLTKTDFGFTEVITGRDNSNNIVDSDRFTINGDASRPQTRADFGATYLVTKNFRISETFSFDRFSINGGNRFAEALLTRTATGGPRNPVFTNTLFYRVTDLDRYSNTLEADFQVRNWLGFNVGWRYTHRKIDVLGFNQPLAPATNTTRTLIAEEEENSTNTAIIGLKLTPMKNWVIFADAEHGDADNAFTRLSNYRFTNLRLRSRWSYKQFAFNISAITKDNENPSTSTAPPGNYPAGNFIANTKFRTFSAFIDYTPLAKLNLSGGYTYQRVTSETDIVINTGTLVRGSSQFFMRDHYGFFDISAQPLKRIGFYASYRHNEDLGQGDRITVLPRLVTSYPYKLRTADSRLAIRLTKNIDWNIGYQYVEYNEAFQPLSVGGPQDYHANLPYTSVRIYFGGNRER